jgi:hypothetical protein
MLATMPLRGLRIVLSVQLVIIARQVSGRLRRPLPGLLVQLAIIVLLALVSLFSAVRAGITHRKADRLLRLVFCVLRDTIVLLVLAFSLQLPSVLVVITATVRLARRQRARPGRIRRLWVQLLQRLAYRVLLVVIVLVHHQPMVSSALLDNTARILLGLVQIAPLVSTAELASWV